MKTGSNVYCVIYAVRNPFNDLTCVGCTNDFPRDMDRIFEIGGYRPEVIYQSVPTNMFQGYNEFLSAYRDKRVMGEWFDVRDISLLKKWDIEQYYAPEYRLWKAGKGLTEISKECGISLQGVYYKFNRWGIDLKSSVNSVPLDEARLPEDAVSVLRKTQKRLIKDKPTSLKVDSTLKEEPIKVESALTEEPVNLVTYTYKFVGKKVKREFEIQMDRPKPMFGDSDFTRWNNEARDKVSAKETEFLEEFSKRIGAYDPSSVVGKDF